MLDGFSVFVVNSDGLISVHKMDRVISSKNQQPVKAFIKKRLEAFLPNKQPSLTQNDPR